MLHGRQFRDQILFPVFHNLVYTVDIANDIGFGLSIAAGDDYPGFGVLTDHLPDDLPGLHRSFLGYRASVDDTDLGLFILQTGAVNQRKTATKVFL